MEGNAAAFKQKPKLKGNKKEDKDKNLKGKIGKGKGKEVVLNYAKFEGQGLSYKAKLFGFVEVPGPRGDQSSVKAIQKLKQQAKQMKKDANEHKLKIIFNITLQGVRLVNEKTQTIEHEHPIHKISFISHDPEDRHVFGYIYSPPRSAANAIRKYYLFAIKSDKSADVVTVQLYELFQVVYKMQENKKALNKDNATVKQKQHEKASQPLEPLQDKMLLEMSNKIGGDQQPYPTDEHLYAEPTFVKQSSSEPPSGYAIPIGQPFQTSSSNESNEDQVPRQEDEISERERQDIATAIALSLSMQENSQPFSESVTTPTTNDESAFEAVFDSTVSFPKEEISGQNTFHAEFSPFENGFTSSEEFKTRQEVSESFNDSEKLSVPGAEEIQMPDVKQVNAFADISSSANTKADFETSQDKNTSVENEVIPSSEPLGEVTPISIEMKDISSNSKEIELQPVEEVVTEIPPANSTIEKFSPFESEKQHDSDATNVEAGPSTPSATSTTIGQTSFEVNFETENEDEKSSTPNQQDLFVFNPDSDAFSDQDPFASTGETEFDLSAFGTFPDNDPFSPNGVSNIDTNSNPFTENNDPFSADLSDEPANNFEQPNASIPDETSSENDRDSNKDEDIFEAMFEAKLEGQCGNETLSKNTNEKEELNIEERQVEFDFEQSNHNTNTELENQGKEINQTTEEVQTPVTLPDKNTTEPDEDEGLNTLDKEISENQHDETNKEDNLNEEDTFDFSLDDVYVTLASSVPPPQSPFEFSPPPLPPRPIIPKESIDTFVSPKIPPALPPRPTISQPSHTETNIRKPPELPPRPDLEDSGSVENELVDTVQEPVSFSNDSASQMFQASFNTFDFDDIENSSPVKSVGTPTAGFDCNDPFKDPFAGADPFQTPIAGDPFASSFDAGAQQDSDDPFSGDDPFAMTPAFDGSFGSPFNTNVQSSDEPNADKQKDQFADFSTAFT